MVGKMYTDPFEIDNDLDGVTGATATSKAIAEAVLRGSHAAAQYLNLPVKPPTSPKIIFGIPEITLLALFGLVGTSIQLIVLGLVLIAAMFIRRPWCNYLCPIRPFLEIISIFRGWVKGLWQKENIGLRDS